MNKLARHRVQSALLLVLVFALALAALHATRATDLEGALHSDEPEWIAASALHWRQLVDGGPPAGAERTPDVEAPWRAGFQSATFGAVNPCLPKLVWGASLAATGRAAASPLVFQRFHRDDPAAGRAARDALLPAEKTARRVSWIATALCGVLLAGIAARLSGPLAGAVALALWLASPLVQRWAIYVRPDFIALAAALGTLAVALALRRALGAAGAPRRLLAAAAIGVAAGLAVSSKLNAAVAALAVGLWVPVFVALCGEGRDGGGRRLANGLLAGLVTAFSGALLVYALNPVLWSSPLAEARAVLEFWGPHMEFQQDRAEPAVRATRTAVERLDLVFERALVRDEPLRAATGVPLGGMLAGVGAMLLGARALLSARAEREREARRDSALTIAWLGVVLLGTTLWIPLDWDRYFFVFVAAAALLEGVAVATIVSVLRRRGGELVERRASVLVEKQVPEPAA